MLPLIVMLAIGGGIVMLPTVERTPAEKQAQADAAKFLGAQIRCENEAKARIADPAGFEVEPYDAWRVVPASADDLAFRFKARARNAVGGLIWADFSCRATYDGEFWTAEIGQA